MAELPPLKERLLPSLLDRLTGAPPGSAHEAPRQRVLSEKEYKKRVSRDLEWLLNTVSLESAQSLDDFPEVADSVVNFGIRELCGHTASSLDLAEIERRLRKAIQRFEPRISNLKLKVESSEEFNSKALSFDIQGDLWMQPMPLRLYWKAEADLDTGTVRVHESKDRNG